MAVANDKDYFKFTVTEKSTVTMELENISSLVEFMTIYLYREEGGHYFKHYASEYFVSSYSIPHVFEPGTYYIALSAGYKTSEKLYDFTVTQAPFVE